METKFTKGEWSVGRKSRKGFHTFVNGRNWDELCRVVTRLKYRTKDSEEGVANLKLIAAAPDLLDAAIKLQEWNKKYPTGTVYHYDRAAQIEKELTEIIELQLAAIKKATE